MVTRIDGDEIDAPHKELMERLAPQLDHATWHGWTPTRWRVGSIALDKYLRGPLTEDIVAIMGVPVVIDIHLNRHTIRLDAE